MTNYVMLRRVKNSPGSVWSQFTAQYARNRKAAVRQSVAEEDYENAHAYEYQAIPARYWNPLEAPES